MSKVEFRNTSNLTYYVSFMKCFTEWVSYVSGLQSTVIIISNIFTKENITQLDTGGFYIQVQD